MRACAGMEAFDMTNFHAQKAVGFVTDREHIICTAYFHNGERANPKRFEFFASRSGGGTQSRLVKHDLIADSKINCLCGRMKATIMIRFVCLLRFGHGDANAFMGTPQFICVTGLEIFDIIGKAGMVRFFTWEDIQDVKRCTRAATVEHLKWRVRTGSVFRSAICKENTVKEFIPSHDIFISRIAFQATGQCLVKVSTLPLDWGLYG